MIAIVTAGGEIEPKEPLYAVTNGGLKSMISIAGKPMIQWVLDALNQSSAVDQIIVVGLPRETDLVSDKPLVLLPDAGGMLNNIRGGAEEALRIEPGATHAILSTGDIPALRAEIVDWLSCQIKDDEQDIYYTLLERATMEASYPKARFSYTHLKNMQVTGGQLHIFRLQAALEETPLWKRLLDARKSPLRQASLLGYDAMLFLLLRQLSLQDAEATICKRLGVKGKALLCPYPEIGVDVDKPAQLEFMREILSKRQEKHAADTQ